MVCLLYLSYKTMNRICYRLSPLSVPADLFIDEEGSALSVGSYPLGVDKNGIKYSGAISTYEEIPEYPLRKLG